MSPADMLWVSSHLVGGSIAVFFAVFQLMSAFRQKPPRRREIFASALLLHFGFVGLLWWLGLSFSYEPFLLALGPLQVALTWFFLAMMSTDKRALVVVGVVAVVLIFIDAFAVAPFAYVAR